MVIPFGDLKRHYFSIRKQVERAVRSVLESGWFILGERCKAFEDAFSTYCGCKFGVGVGSGTEALHLGLVACGVRPGDEVITVANTCVPTISAISSAGARPVFVDVHPQSYNMDPTQIKPKITSKTRAILPVHLYGQAADLDPILSIARERNLKIVEDCAQAHGTEYKGQKVGSFGDVGCFSFYPSKNLGAFGDGGMVVTSAPEIAENLKMLRNYGQSRRYHHDIKGYNSRLDEIQASILHTKLSYLDGWNSRRNEIAGFYREHVNHPDIIHPCEMGYGRHNFHLYVVRVPERDGLKIRLKEKGIGTEIHFPIPIHHQKAYSDLNIPGDSLPVTERFCGEILSLPNYPELNEEEIGYIAQTIQEEVG